MIINFSTYAKNTLGALYKDNEVDLYGLEVETDLDLFQIDKIEVNFEIDENIFTDSVSILDRTLKLISIPFKSEILMPGVHKLELVAYMKNGNIETSQTCVYTVEEAIGEGENLNNNKNNVGEGVVNFVKITKSDETLDVFDSDGKYIKTLWMNGDTITDTKLNKIEEAISLISDDKLVSIENSIKNRFNNFEEAIDDRLVNSEQVINNKFIDMQESMEDGLDNINSLLENEINKVNESVKKVDNNKINDIEVNQNETNDTQTALDLFNNGEKVKTIYFSGGSGGSTGAYISTTLPEDMTVGINEDFELLLDFASPNPGKGTLKAFINDIEALSTSITQGESMTKISSSLFSKGNNKLVVYVLDRKGQMSNSLTFYIRYGSTEITSDFDVYSAYDYGSTVRYYFTPTALDASAKLTFYMSIDGEVQEGLNCTSDKRGYYTFPNNLSADSHYCEAYIIDGNGVKSNVLTFNLIILDTNTIVVASDTKNITAEEGEQISLDYKIYMKNNSSFITKTYVDNELVNVGTCGLDTNYYKTSSLTEGIHTIKLEVWDVTETYRDYVTWTITVTPGTYEMLQPINAGAMFIGSAVNKTNTDERKQYFIGQDQEGNEVLGALTNFAYNSESGWVNDELIISGNSHVEIPIQPLANNARYGFTLDIEFTSKQIGVEDAEVLTLWNDEKDCGIKITTEKLILRSAEGNECNLYYSDNEKTNVIFVIDRNEAKAKVYLNGVMCEAFHLNDYTINGIAYLEDFAVNGNIILGGKNKNGYSKIRNLRVYEVALTTDEILNNWMSCETNKSKQRELVEFQKGNDLPTLTIYCDFSGLGKDDKKPCKIVYNSTDEVKYGESFTLDHKQSQLQYQGTSSMAYPIKNYRLNLRNKDGSKLYYELPGSQPECRFTLKADFMNSCHAHNTGMAKFINDNLYNYNLKDEKSMNPFKWHHVQNGGNVNDFREAINGFPCRLILVNDGESPLNEGQNEPTPGNTKDMGIFNFNNDKDNVTTLGFNSDIFPNCASYEVTANSDTSAGAFMSYGGSGSHEDELAYLKESFELRHPDEDDVAEDWGFMGIEKEALKIDEFLYYGNVRTSNMEANYFNSDSITITFDNNASFSFNPTGTNVSPQYGVRSGTTISLEGVDRFYLGAKGWTYVDINGNRYYKGITREEGAPTKDENPYESTIFDTSYGLKALIDWVDNCTDEEFVRDFEQHFHKDYTLRYYALVVLIGAVDNLGKNMMLDTADNKVFFPRFYDIDTILSYDNSGDIKFNVDIEVEQGYWNTSSSRLWTRIRDLFHDDIVATYNNMRQNGVSYENIMKYMYDEQIAKIPQAYYNKDYDIKYAPFEDQYIGMAHGNGYEHMKRWLKNRFIFCDTLFDYAPSYNNDVLTIRANTTELMNLEIETYTPVYQHLSWYNGQMDKKKIDGKVSTAFSGTAMTATDQEVLIYGGSNIKRIKGISSMNPNQMLIGSATRLIELDASNSPLLADINSNKANLSPHTYLNKVNLSNCPQLGGNLRLNNSPLIQEVDVKGTNITGLNLPSSIRNLQVLRLPNTTTELILNDAGMLHTLDFDEGVNLQSVSMTNCNALENVTGLDLLQTPSITLNNSYNNVAELYFKDTTNLSLSNMTNLERVIYTPNNEYETFELINVANAPNYTISTFNCPKLSTFMTTAPYRESYNNGDYGDIQPNTTFTANSIDISNTQFTDVKLLCTTDTNVLKLPTTVKNFYCDSSFDLDTDYLEDGEYDVVHGELVEPYTTDYEGEVKVGEPTNVEYDLNTLREFSEPPTGEFLEVIPNSTFSITTRRLVGQFVLAGYDKDKKFVKYLGKGYNSNVDNTTETYPIDDSSIRYIQFFNRATNNSILTLTYSKPITPNLIPSSADGSLIFSMYAPSNTVAPASGTWDLHGLEFDNFHTFGMNNDVKQDSEGNITMPARYDDYNITIKNANISPKTHNTMLYPLLVNEDNPITGTLDYTNYAGKHLSWSFAYTDEEYVDIIQPKDELLNSYEYRYNAFYDTEYEFDNPYEIARYTANAIGVLPTFNTEFTYTYDEKDNGDGTYTIKVYADSLDNLPTRISFADKGGLVGIDKLNMSKVTDMSNMFRGQINLAYIKDVSNWDVSNVTNMTQVFYSTKNLISLDLSDWNTSSVTNMTNMFCDCRGLISLDLSGFVTSNVTNMSYMFYNCNNLTSLDVSGFNTGNVTSMYNMFNSCRSLTSLDLSGFDTSNVTSMANMFYDCRSLTSLDVSGFDTSNVANMGDMFRGCNSLTSLNLSVFNTSKVTNMGNMFYDCRSLIELDSMQNVSENLDLSATILDATSLLDVIDNLVTVTTTKTLTLGSTLLAKLTEDQIAIAINKGWTVV